MGITTRLYHRSEGLSENRYNTFFMDMGENIHIHYRDLRIELSVDEFLQFAELCDVYIPQVKKAIEGGYRDGALPNTNQSNTITTFFNKEPLKQKVVYNPTRISLEENTDGYHIHLRNYKILLDKASFLVFARAAKEVLDIRERTVDLQETLSLLRINELVHHVDEISHDESYERAVVTVEEAYHNKTLQLLDGLKYRKADSTADAVIYEKDNARIYLRVGQAPKLSFWGAVGSSVVPLTEYLKENALRFTPQEINLLKLQVLDFFEYAKKNNVTDIVELDHRKLIYDTAGKKVIFPSKERKAATNADHEWSRFYTFLNKHKLGFVKPKKIFYTETELKRLDEAFRAHVKERLIKHRCVKKIYLLNPISWKMTGSGTGRYEAPFLHISWVKLGSDFDVLIEIDERYPVPTEWDFKFFWDVCGADYYHLGEVDFPIPSPYIEKFPNITFRHHLIEAYLFFPSRMNKQVKDDYLGKFPSEVLYERIDTADLLPDFIAERYGIKAESPELIGGISFNEVFRVKTGKGDYIAKVMKGAEFTPAAQGHRGKHLAYEVKLLAALAGKDLPVVMPIPGKDGKMDQDFNGKHCMLFPFIKADESSDFSEEALKASARTLALVHRELSEDVATTEAYGFNDSLNHWLNDLETLYAKFTDDKTRQEQFKPLTSAVSEARRRITGSKRLPWVHCHGDVSRRNFLYVDGKALLFDFQAAHHGPRVEDVAEGALEFSFRKTELDQALIDKFIAAYEGENPLSDAERDLLPTMQFLHAAVKLSRLLRMEVVFGNKVDQNRVAAFLNYALAGIRDLSLLKSPKRPKKSKKQRNVDL